MHFWSFSEHNRLFTAAIAVHPLQEIEPVRVVAQCVRIADHDQQGLGSSDGYIETLEETKVDERRQFRCMNLIEW
jgi:ribulose 1,5-bisphosphate carboxylase large subunit-like protein